MSPSAMAQEPAAVLKFPSDAMVPATLRQFELRTLLYQLLSDNLGPRLTVGANQFVYYDANEPKECLTTDVFVRLLPRSDDILCWKTWELGVPDVAVEIVSDGDWPVMPWLEKLSRYARLGVKELLRFDPMAPAGKRLRAWDRVNERLTEREVVGDVTPSQVLGLTWVVAPAESMVTTLRIAVDEAGRELIASRLEALKAEPEARQAAEARIRELEEELKRRG